MVVIGAKPEAQLLAFVNEWLRLVARADWASALAMLDGPGSHGRHWTRESLLEMLNQTFGPQTPFARRVGIPAFSEPHLATGVQHWSIGETASGGYWLDVAIPLNGEFSDLSAQFEFQPRSGGYVATLRDLHVL